MIEPAEISRRVAAAHLRACFAARAWPATFALLIAALFPLDAAFAAPAAAKVQGDETAGYARLVLKFDDMPAADTKLSNGILVINFASAVSLPLDRLTGGLPSYVAAARLDPDGKAIRLALSQHVRVNTMEAGERLFVDLLPDSWRAAPPSLPQDVIDELNAKAKEAERLRREADARIARAKPKPVTVRAARQPTFTRLTFDIGDPVPVRLERSGNDVSLTFDAALHADLRMLKAELPPRLNAIDAEEKDARLAVVLKIADGSDVRAFWESGAYIVDVAGGKTGAAGAMLGLPPDLVAALAPDAAPGNGVTTLEAPKPGRSAEATQTALPALVQSEPEAVAVANPPVGNPAPEAVPAPASSAPAATPALPARPALDAPVATPTLPARPAIDAPVVEASPAAKEPSPAPQPAKGVVPASSAGSGPMPAADLPIPEKAAATDPLTPVLTHVGDTVRIGFGFDRRTAGAVYRRGDSLWLIFDTLRKVDVGAIADSAKDLIASATAMPSDGGVAIRIKLHKTPLTTMSPDGTSWIVSIGDDILSGAAPVPLRRMVGKDGRTAVRAALDGVGSVHRIADAEVGDSVTVVTAAPPARAFLKSQEFVEFRTLPTAHGLAFIPSSDDITVSIGFDDVTVTRDGGLTLSPDPGPAADGQADGAHEVQLVNTGTWSREVEAPFQARERDLLHLAAAATEAERLQARMALARFYLAKNFGAEAAAVLDVARAADENAGHSPEFGLLLAASRAMVSRGSETNQILEEFGLRASADAALWQAVAEASNHHFAAAREAFQKGAGSLARYPSALQARFRMAALESALEVGEIAEAAVQKAALDALKVEVPDPGRRALLEARLAEMQDKKTEALEAYRRVAEGPDAISAADARLRAIKLRHSLGQVDDKGLVDELETLAATWRGDEVEAQTLATLADERLKEGEDRKAFESMEVALERFPKSETTRAMQDKMQERFISIFLDGGAEKMKPVDALALFYDHRELTPADRRGDEMIRKLADRLVEVDLLDQAADLLQHQIDHRLVGAGRAQVAAKLAMVDLMNRKPMQALQALSSTRQADLPKQLVNARLIIEARALSESARPDLALEILDQLDTAEVADLRSDVLWQARRWPEAGAAIETGLGDSWQGPASLTDAQRAAAMRAAIAYSLAEDKLSLDRLRSKFADKMANSADAPSFETVTAPIEARGTRFGDLAKQIAAADTLDAFLADYKKRYADQVLVEPASPSAAADPKATAG